MPSKGAPLAAAGNRFVYALAPTLNITPDNKVRTYGSANPALTATSQLGRIMVSGLLEMQERRNGTGSEHRIGNEMVGEFRGQRLM